MHSLVILINTVVNIFIWMLIAQAVLSWLIAFNIVNYRNEFVFRVSEFLNKISEPALRPIRNVLPNLGGIDLSPMILILLLMFLRNLLFEYAF